MQRLNKRFRLGEIAGVWLAIAALVAALAGCGSDSSDAGAPVDAGQAPGGGGPAMPGIMGEVLSLEGSTLVVRDEREGGQGTASVVLTDNTQIFTQATLTIAQLPSGEKITAMGSPDGDVFVASQVRIGAMDFGAASGRPAQSGQPPQGDAPPERGNAPNGARQPPNGAPGQGVRLSGTIVSVTGDTITIKTPDDATAHIRLGAGAQIVQQVTAARADLKPGVWVMVTGEQTDATLSAARIVIMPAAPQQP